MHKKKNKKKIKIDYKSKMKHKYNFLNIISFKNQTLENSIYIVIYLQEILLYGLVRGIWKLEHSDVSTVPQQIVLKF